MIRRSPSAIGLFVVAFALTTLAILGGGAHHHRPALAAAERRW